MAPFHHVTQIDLHGTVFRGYYGVRDTGEPTPIRDESMSTRMAKATVASHDAKTEGASGLLRKTRRAAPKAETEAAESAPARIHGIDLSSVPQDPPGGRPLRPVGWPGFANALGRLATTRG